MRPLFLLRLALDFLAAGLLLAALAYNWLGNLAHEVIGTSMFLLLISHNVFNRRWYGTIARGRREARTLITKVANLSLLASMLTLLVTSLIISQDVFSFLPLTSSVSARQIHTTAGYLALLLASIHLGLHWAMIMGVARTRSGITSTSDGRSFMLRALALLGSAYGLVSLVAADVRGKLLMQMSFDFGTLQVPAAVSLLQHAAIIWLGACLGHYGTAIVRQRRPAYGQNS